MSQLQHFLAAALAVSLQRYILYCLHCPGFILRCIIRVLYYVDWIVRNFGDRLKIHKILRSCAEAPDDDYLDQGFPFCSPRPTSGLGRIIRWSADYNWSSAHQVVHRPQSVLGVLLGGLRTTYRPGRIIRWPRTASVDPMYDPMYKNN